MITRPDGYELLVTGWAQAASSEAKRDRKRRMTLVEGTFGQAAQNHHFKRARWRRLWRQSIQDHLIAAVQNVKKIITHGLKPTESLLSPEFPPIDTFPNTMAEITAALRCLLGLFCPSLTLQ